MLILTGITKMTADFLAVVRIDFAVFESTILS